MFSLHIFLNISIKKKIVEMKILYIIPIRKNVFNIETPNLCIFLDGEVKNEKNISSNYI